MKIEFDIPEFKRELKIEITIRRDGEVIYSASSSSAGEDSVAQKPATKSPASKPTEKKPAKSSGGGNMMNMEF